MVENERPTLQNILLQNHPRVLPRLQNLLNQVKASDGRTVPNAPCVRTQRFHPTPTRSTSSIVANLEEQAQRYQLDQMDTRQSSRSDLPRHHSYHSTQEFGSGSAPGISVHQATPQGTNYSNVIANNSLPGALQPGRPGASSTNTAPSAVPTLPQISSHGQQPPSSSRPSTSGHTHSYSRSSPAGLDQQKYVPFSNTPENNKYASPTNQRYTASQTPQGGGAYSPLALGDIRGLADDPQSANPLTSDGHPSEPTNCNYLAPWPVYAFDWCKWPVPQQSSGDGAGKMAIGSYIEDPHNFVSGPLSFVLG